MRLSRRRAVEGDVAQRSASSSAVSVISAGSRRAGGGRSASRLAGFRESDVIRQKMTHFASNRYGSSIRLRAIQRKVRGGSPTWPWQSLLISAVGHAVSANAQSEREQAVAIDRVPIPPRRPVRGRTDRPGAGLALVARLPAGRQISGDREARRHPHIRRDGSATRSARRRPAERPAEGGQRPARRRARSRLRDQPPRLSSLSPKEPRKPTAPPSGRRGSTADG